MLTEAKGNAGPEGYYLPKLSSGEASVPPAMAGKGEKVRGQSFPTGDPSL